MTDLYREEIMDHYQNPRNSGHMKNPSLEFHDSNPVCGDEITVQARIGSGKLTDIMYVARGCAISQSAASMLSEHVRNMKISDVARMGADQMINIMHINPGPVRIKCAMLALRALQKGILRYAAK